MIYILTLQDPICRVHRSGKFQLHQMAILPVILFLLFDTELKKNRSGFWKQSGLERNTDYRRSWLNISGLQRDMTIVLLYLICISLKYLQCLKWRCSYIKAIICISVKDLIWKPMMIGSIFRLGAHFSLTNNLGYCVLLSFMLGANTTSLPRHICHFLSG